MIYKQERPNWCPHIDCIFKRRASENMICGGNLPIPEPHGKDFNTFRLCYKDLPKEGEILDFQVNKTDLEWFRYIFDALDEKKTSWLSKL